ncbi:methyl-accepting chemotaxis protein [Marinomonas algarum]|uniref:Methyl-accepting chemotaxis protein n=1 Tax=Marinomonas algarum TaxID=2883105 RepID=A0A9X1IJK7_9GAMM|nr:methyl-accepting chemotaxis protein [Marinomonas algarum]MCB5160455.1 methyl-accepting chemotaxis protein [Marinomonas algarum]
MAQVPILLVSGLIGEQLFSFTLFASVFLAVATQLAYSLFKGQLAFSVLAGILMMVVSSLLIQSQYGLTEMHFHIFASMVVLLIYHKWQPIIAALVTTALYHVVFMYVQMANVHVGDMPIMVFSGHHNMNLMLVHCLFATAEAGVLIYMAHLMTKASSSNNKVASAIEQVSKENDLSVRVPNPSSSAEYALNQLLDTLSSLFGDYQRIAATLTQSSDQISCVADRANASVEQSKHRSIETASATEEVSQSMKSVAQSSLESADIVGALEKEIIEDQQQALTIMKDMELLSDDTKRVSDSLQALTSDVNAITSLLQSIRSISEQTNLLALNAAIEAARAGETGRGFAVVADEVRALASRSSQSTDDIEKVLERLNASVANTVTSMESGQKRTQLNVEHALTISNGLNKRAEDVSAIAVSSQTVAQSTLEQDKVVALISQKVTENADTIQVLFDLMTELAQSRNDVNRVTQEYQEKARLFKI